MLPGVLAFRDDQPCGDLGNVAESFDRLVGENEADVALPPGPHPVIGVAAISPRVNSRRDACAAGRPMVAQSMRSDHPPSGRMQG